MDIRTLRGAFWDGYIIRDPPKNRASKKYVKDFFPQKTKIMP